MAHITEIFVEGEALDLYTDGRFKYKVQVNKIAELKDRQASYLNSTNVPKTAKNIRILRGLSIPSDMSSIPYSKPNCQLKVDGFNFVSKGWLGVDESGDDFKIKIYVGIVQFFKAIEGKKIGTDLDLTLVNKPKNLASVLDSFTSPYYRYLIADYNGKTHYGVDDKKINIDYLVPSINVKYIWDLIHKTFGFTYSGLIFDSSQFNNLWITYPKPIPLNPDIPLLDVSGTFNIIDKNVNWNIPEQFYNQMIFGGLDQNRSYKFTESGKFRIIFEGDASLGAPQSGQYFLRVNQVGQPFHTTTNPDLLFTMTGQSTQHFRAERVMDFQVGDEIDLYTLIWVNGAIKWHSTHNLKISKIDDASADFSTELKDFAITDFIKDVLNMFGLTPFTNELTSNIDYRLITERFVTAEAVDWSSKFVKRKNEKYVYESFAQSNNFRYQYNDKEGDYHDGAIRVNNLNLQENREVFKSKIYSPELELREFYIGAFGTTLLRVFKMYDKNVTEKNGQTKIEYKSLDKRFHYCRSNTFPVNVVIGSEQQLQEQTVTSLPLIDYSGLPWQRLLDTFYPSLGRVIADSRIHEIEVNLDPTDLILLDMTKMVYFEQEQQYYVIDSIDYDGDEVGVGRFVRAKRDPNAIVIPIDPVDPTDYVIGVEWTNGGGTAERTGFLLNESVKQTTLSYPASDPIVSLTWQRSSDGTNWVDMGTAVPILNVALDVGRNEFRVKGVTVNGLSYYSVVLRYNRQTTNCRYYRASQLLTSGECLSFSYVDCYTGQVLFADICHQGGSGAQYYDVVRCAAVDSVSTSGTLTEEGNC